MSEKMLRREENKLELIVGCVLTSGASKVVHYAGISDAKFFGFRVEFNRDLGVLNFCD